MTEQPELDLVRISYEATNIMAEKIQSKIENNNSDEITAIAVPESMHESYHKKFKLYEKFDKCAEIIKEHIIQHPDIPNTNDNFRHSNRRRQNTR